MYESRCVRQRDLPVREIVYNVDAVGIHENDMRATKRHGSFCR